MMLLLLLMMMMMMMMQRINTRVVQRPRAVASDTILLSLYAASYAKSYSFSGAGLPKGDCEGNCAPQEAECLITFLRR